MHVIELEIMHVCAKSSIFFFRIFCTADSHDELNARVTKQNCKNFLKYKIKYRFYMFYSPCLIQVVPNKLATPPTHAIGWASFALLPVGMLKQTEQCLDCATQLQ